MRSIRGILSRPAQEASDGFLSGSDTGRRIKATKILRNLAVTPDILVQLTVVRERQRLSYVLAKIRAEDVAIRWPPMMILPACFYIRPNLDGYNRAARTIHLQMRGILRTMIHVRILVCQINIRVRQKRDF